MLKPSGLRSKRVDDELGESMRAIDAARKLLVTVPPDATLEATAKAMNEKVVGSVVVVDGQRPVGIVTDRDLVVRGLSRGLPPDARVDGLMSRDLVTLDADVDLRKAYPLFRTHAIRRLPLTRKGEIVAMLSVDDLLIDTVADLADCVRPITGEVIFGYSETERTPAAAGGAS